MDNIDYKNLTFDEKIKTIEETTQNLKSDTIRKVVVNSSNSDALKIIEKYHDSLKSDSIFRISNNREKKAILPQIIDMTYDNITYRQFIKIINNILDVEKRKEYIIKYCNKIDIYDSLVYDLLNIYDSENIDINFLEKLFDNLEDSYDIAFIICDLPTDKLEIEYLKKYQDKFDSIELSKIIGSIENYSIRLEIYELFKDRIHDEDIKYMITSGTKREDLVHAFIHRFEGKLKADDYSYILMNVYKDDTVLIGLDKYIDKMNPEGISRIISKNINHLRSRYDKKTKDFLGLTYYYSDEKFLDKDYIVNLLNKYSKYLDGFDIGNIIKKIDDIDLKYYTFEETIYKINPDFKRIIDKLENKNEWLNKIRKLDDNSLSALFSIYSDKDNNINSVDELYFSIDFLNKINNSNSSEIRRISAQIFREILKQPKEKWESSYKTIEETFVKNNVPYVGKIFEVFNTLHPNILNTRRKPKSPNINSLKSEKAVNLMLFNDVLRCSLSSNNRSIKKYLDNIKKGNEILVKIIDEKTNIDGLTDEEREIYIKYLNLLNSLYNHTEYGKNNKRKMKNNLEKDTYELLSLFLKNEREKFLVSELPNRVVRMFTHFIGIDKIDDLVNYMELERKRAHNRNVVRATEKDFTIEKGDFIKGLGGKNTNSNKAYYQYLTSILQNGNLCQEFLGSSASSDATPLDADVSRINKDKPFRDIFKDGMCAASRYGPIWIVLKNDEKFNNSDETHKYIPDKLEVFNTGVLGEDHYGIRTGFPSSDIDFFVVNDFVNVNILKYEIVMNDFYIPITDINGNLIFKPEEYNNLHDKMLGLSYYGTDQEYKFAKELDYFDISDEPYNIQVDDSIREVYKTREEILDKLHRVNLDVILGRSDDLSNTSLELIDTGSTGRGTNKMNDYDFDFIMRIDRNIFSDEEKMLEINKKIKKAFPGITIESNGKIRDQVVNLSDNRTAKLDITFISKTDKLHYSTDECIKDRLNNIKELDRVKYRKVLENIILAKEVLKECYKPKHAGKGKAQGGLGGVGVENWILQNGGSLEAAAKNFLEVSKGKSFDEFKKIYTVWDFGENHMAETNGKYMHDEFVSNNMDDEGYKKMKIVLEKYINNLEEKRVKESGNRHL